MILILVFRLDGCLDRGDCSTQSKFSAVRWGFEWSFEVWWSQQLSQSRCDSRLLVSSWLQPESQICCNRVFFKRSWESRFLRRHLVCAADLLLLEGAHFLGDRRIRRGAGGADGLGLLSLAFRLGLLGCKWERQGVVQKNNVVSIISIMRSQDLDISVCLRACNKIHWSVCYITKKRPFRFELVRIDDRFSHLAKRTLCPVQQAQGSRLRGSASPSALCSRSRTPCRRRRRPCSQRSCRSQVRAPFQKR